jgi:hypothetical protein
MALSESTIMAGFPSFRSELGSKWPVSILHAIWMSWPQLCPDHSSDETSNVTDEHYVHSQFVMEKRRTGKRCCVTSSQARTDTAKVMPLRLVA